jgi:hypothetical protein
MLSQQQHSVLCAVKDWKAPYEIAAILFPRGASIPQRKKVAQALRELHDGGLVEYGRPNNTYRRTDKGSSALAGQ